MVTFIAPNCQICFRRFFNGISSIKTDCVMAELEKLGSKYRVALRLAKDRKLIPQTKTRKQLA